MKKRIRWPNRAEPSKVPGPPKRISLGRKTTESKKVKSEKAYSLEMEDRGTYLYAVAGGDRLTAQISAAYWNEIAERGFEMNCRKVLIEKNFKEGVGPVDMLQMAEHLAQLLPEWRIAFVDRYHHDEINELGKKLVRNRDVLLQTFANVNEAERWLAAN